MTAVFGGVGGAEAHASGTPTGLKLGTVFFSQAGTNCASGENSRWLIPNTGTTVPLALRNADDGVAVGPDANGNEMVYTTCWRDNTLVFFAPPTQSALNAGYTVTASKQLLVRVAGVTGLGAIAYDGTRHLIWACSINPNYPESSAQVGTIPLPAESGASVSFTPTWKAPSGSACDDHLGYDPTNDSIWTGADIAKGSLWDQTGIDATPTGTQVAVPSAVPATAGVAPTATSLLLSDPQGTSKYVDEVIRSSPIDLTGTSYRVMSSSMRIDALACDDHNYTQPVVWVNFGKYDEFQVWTIPSQAACGYVAPPAPTGLTIAQTPSPSPATADGQLTYTVTVANSGSEAQGNVTVTDSPPEDAIFESATASSGSGCSTTPVQCNLGTLGAGGSATVSVVVTPIVPQPLEQNTVSAVSDQTVTPVTTSTPTVQVVGDGLTSYVSLTDSGGFSAPTARLAVGAIQAVQWNILGPSEHGVQDSTGLISLQPVAPVAYLASVFGAAGTYVVHDSNPAFSGSSLSVPVGLKATSGRVSSGVPIAWASMMPAGASETIQYRPPGVTAWKAWMSGQTGIGATFTALTTTGTYKFRARLRFNGIWTGFSPVLSVKVTS